MNARLDQVTPVSDLVLCDDSSAVSVCERTAQQHALTQMTQQHGHLFHGPPATHQHHLSGDSIGLSITAT